MITSDILSTVFVTQGVTATVGALAQVANAEDRLLQAQTRRTRVAITGQGNLLDALISEQSALRSLGVVSLNAAQQSAQGFIRIVQTGEAAIQKLVEFSNEVRNLQALTGASASDSAQAATLFRVAGIGDTQALRDVLRLSQDLKSKGGGAALSQLGISSAANQDGLALFNKIADRLAQMPDGLKKAQIEAQLFGNRGVIALQPLLRLTAEQREKSLALGRAFDTDALKAVQSFQFAVGYAGQDILTKIVYPIAQRLLPIFEFVIDKVTFLVDTWGKLDAAFGHIPSWIVTLVGVAAAFVSIVRVIGFAITAYKTLKAAIQATAVVQAVLDALEGNWGALAAAAAIGGIGVYAINKFLPDGNDNAKEDKFGRHVDRFGDAVDKMTDNWEQWNRGGRPRDLHAADIGAVEREMSLRVIG